MADRGSVRVRLAPSPTGTLHIGTARTAVFNWLFARHQGGLFLLRIEDTDRERSRPEFTANILDGLRWLGLDWDDEPVIQSARIEAHQAAIRQLLDQVIARRAPADRIGDPLYNLVVVVDDVFMAISHVIRGEDHIANTAKQLLLYQALGVTAPEFAHTPLILNQEGKKLSKRDGVTSIGDFKELGYTQAAMVNYMTLLGWSPPEGMGERFSLEEAARVFDFDRVNKAGARFDWDKLNWLNGQVLHGLSPSELRQQLLPLWQAQGWAADGPTADPDWQSDLCTLLGPSLTKLVDGVGQATAFFLTPSPDDQARAQLAQPGAA
ncbi:MAG: glutamate--tRNA ligase family protein, partial [Cyanobacteria bacterium]|nr:glutamate--tRNA ligase family protein [Cyanobacteriota bacterium]